MNKNNEYEEEALDEPLHKHCTWQQRILLESVVKQAQEDEDLSLLNFLIINACLACHNFFLGTSEFKKIKDATPTLKKGSPTMLRDLRDKGKWYFYVSYNFFIEQNEYHHVFNRVICRLSSFQESSHISYTDSISSCYRFQLVSMSCLLGNLIWYVFRELI